MLATVVLLAHAPTADRIETAARDEAVALRAEIDRLKALLLAEPQVLVAWAAAADEPEIVGDTSIIVPGGAPERVLAFGSLAGAGGGAAHGARGRDAARRRPRLRR